MNFYKKVLKYLPILVALIISITILIFFLYKYYILNTIESLTSKLTPSSFTKSTYKFKRSAGVNKNIIIISDEDEYLKWNENTFSFDKTPNADDAEVFIFGNKEVISIDKSGDTIDQLFEQNSIYLVRYKNIEDNIKIGSYKSPEDDEFKMLPVLSGLIKDITIFKDVNETLEFIEK